MVHSQSVSVQFLEVAHGLMPDLQPETVKASRIKNGKSILDAPAIMAWIMYPNGMAK